MKALRILLSIYYGLFAVTGLGLTLLGTTPHYTLIVVLCYVAVVAALNSKGGKATRVIAFIVSVLFMVGGLLSLLMFISTFFGQEYDAITPITLAVMGIVGMATALFLRKQVSAKTRYHLAFKNMYS